VIDPDWPTLKRDDFRARWKQGKFGIMWEDFCALACVANYPAFDKNFPNAEWIAVPAPKGPDGKAYYGVFNPSGQVFAVSKKAADAGKVKAIAKLLEWMAGKEGYYLLGFGVENVNYKFDKDGKITTEGLDPKQAWTDASQQPFTQLRNSLIYYNAPEEVIARYPSHKTQNGRVLDPITYYNYFKGQPWIDGRGTQTIVSPKNIGDFNTYYNQGLVKFALGQTPLTDATWADFIKGLDGLGAKAWEESAKKDLQAGGFLK
jgi:putative aldouronate transport system substrate-binding protein